MLVPVRLKAPARSSIILSISSLSQRKSGRSAKSPPLFSSSSSWLMERQLSSGHIAITSSGSTLLIIIHVSDVMWRHTITLQLLLLLQWYSFCTFPYIDNTFFRKDLFVWVFGKGVAWRNNKTRFDLNTCVFYTSLIFGIFVRILIFQQEQPVWISVQLL